MAVKKTENKTTKKRKTNETHEERKKTDIAAIVYCFQYKVSDFFCALLNRMRANAHTKNIYIHCLEALCRQKPKTFISE